MFKKTSIHIQYLVLHFSQSLPWLIIRNLLLKIVMSFYCNITILCAKISRVNRALPWAWSRRRRSSVTRRTRTSRRDFFLRFWSFVSTWTRRSFYPTSRSTPSEGHLKMTSQSKILVFNDWCPVVGTLVWCIKKTFDLTKSR